MPDEVLQVLLPLIFFAVLGLGGLVRKLVERAAQQGKVPGQGGPRGPAAAGQRLREFFEKLGEELGAEKPKEPAPKPRPAARPQGPRPKRPEPVPQRKPPPRRPLREDAGPDLGRGAETARRGLLAEESRDVMSLPRRGAARGRLPFGAPAGAIGGEVGRRRLQQAVVWAEILGKPRSKRPWEGFGS